MYLIIPDYKVYNYSWLYHVAVNTVVAGSILLCMAFLTSGKISQFL